ncbi:MAG TPA: FlgD immunoglobulin-like domain containing protein [Actinomycetota bacterium]
MRTRPLALAASIAIGIAMLTAAPASAAHTVSSIGFPDGHTEFYSPFGGPATVTFAVDAADTDATFSVRLRPFGENAIHTEQVFVDNEDADGTKVFDLDWPALSVSSATQYEVVVFRNGVFVDGESFFLHPKLVRITDITPDPFLPWIDDGHKDVTHVKFSLAADVDAAEVRIFAPKSTGACCGNLLRDESLGPLSGGANVWDWDGRKEDGTNLPKGGYWVRVWADDGVLAPGLSKPVKVSIARTYRATDTMSKPARRYHHVGPITPLVAAGDCRIFVDPNDDHLRILCQTAKVTVYWRWGLDAGEKIVKQSFVIENPTSGCPSSIRSTGHSQHESFFAVNDDEPGISASCELVTAKITYSYDQSS